MIRAKDLAAKLGVSAATVSLVLNDKPGICDDTRRELRKRIVDMGYGYMLKTPEKSMEQGATAKLREAQTVEQAGRKAGAQKKFAFVIYPVCKECGDTASFYTQVMEGASAYLQEKGYDMMVYHVKPECGCALECLADKDIMGMIVQKPCLETVDVDQLQAMNLPFVMLDTYYTNTDISSVSVNNEQGVYKLIHHLREQGHERIGYISCGLERAAFDERKGYYYMLLAQQGLPYHPDWSVPLSDDEKLCRVLADPQGPTAFLTDNDIIAWKAIQKIRTCGYRVPEQIAVTGFEDHSLGLLSDPRLTTIHVPYADLGREAARVLLTKIDRSQLAKAGHPDAEPDVPVKVELGVELVVRESTACKK